jgi:hypothetical protein
MSLILSGTDGLSDIDGSAATPAIRGTDANTGIFFDTDIIGFAEGGAEVARFDSSGNLLIGTASPIAPLTVASSTTLAGGSPSIVLTGESNTERIQIRAAGGALAGAPVVLTAASRGTVAVPTAIQSGDTLGFYQFGGYNGTGFTRGAWVQGIADGAYSATNQGSHLAFSTTPNASTTIAERARIDSSGNLLVGTTNTSLTAGVGAKLIASATEPYISYVINAASGSNYHLYNTNATNNGYRFYVLTNGGIANYSANNQNLSDERTKTNIELSGNYLEKICAIPVKLFNYRDEPENEQRTLGVIAQDVEAVAPEFVNNDGWKGTDPEDGVPLKTVYTTDITFALMKCIQEQQALITALTARITALETQNADNPPQGETP